jgi:hypothetical protein
MGHHYSSATAVHHLPSVSLDGYVVDHLLGGKTEQPAAHSRADSAHNVGLFSDAVPRERPGLVGQAEG